MALVIPIFQILEKKTCKVTTSGNREEFLCRKDNYVIRIHLLSPFLRGFVNDTRNGIE